MKTVLAFVFFAFVSALSLASGNNPFDNNSAEWRTVHAFGEDVGGTPVSCSYGNVLSACYAWHASFSTAKSTLDRFMLDDAPDRYFIEAAGPWQQRSGTAISRAYEMYGSKVMLVVFDGRRVVFASEKR